MNHKHEAGVEMDFPFFSKSYKASKVQDSANTWRGKQHTRSANTTRAGYVISSILRAYLVFELSL